MMRSGLLILILVPVLAISCQEREQADSSQARVILITMDGFRWQELFTGADSGLIRDPEYVSDTTELIKEFWAQETSDRRKKLLPFFWSEIEARGALLGNRWLNSKVDLTNKYWFSYPGYNEILTGFADDSINSNNKVNNHNITILEFVNRLSGFEGKVAAFTSWDVFPYIINEERSGVYVNAGFDTASFPVMSSNEKLLNRIQSEVPKTWETVRVDAFTHHYALEYLKKKKPRLLYISYGETDDFAHDGRYDQYLRSAHQTDRFIKELWMFVNSDPGFKGHTSILITTDHGRGTVPRDTWRSHGSKIPGANQVWIAAIGAGVNNLGESKDDSLIYQDQVAATLAGYLGVDYTNKNAGKPISILMDK